MRTKLFAQVVANCHKQPQHLFEKVYITVEEMESELRDTLSKLLSKNPSIAVILTVSPVRHWKDGAGKWICDFLFVITTASATFEITRFIRLLPSLYSFVTSSFMCVHLLTVENSLSKSSLIVLSHRLVQAFPKRWVGHDLPTALRAKHSYFNYCRVFYFPSYELLVDDVRDYRFYAQDVLHPLPTVPSPSPHHCHTPPHTPQ